MNIVILDDHQDAVRTLDCFAKLEGHAVTIHNDTVRDIDQLATRLSGADAVVLNREYTAITESLLQRLPRLQLVSQTARAIPHIDVAACTRRGIVVSAGGRSPYTTGELTWALILASMRRIPLEAARLRAGRWQTTLGDTVRGRTLGIFGYGTIGSQVAGYGKVFGMRVLAWGREGSLSRARLAGFETAPSKQALFAQADVLSLHIQLTPATREVVRREDLACMKPTALFVNTSRAALVAPGALVEALRAGRPGSAAIDVFEEEPVLGGDHPLLKMDNVLCTPHLGYVVRDTYELWFDIAFDQVRAFVEGRSINVINPEVLR